MTWYLYTGDRATSIPIGNDEVLSVAPHRVVEVIGSNDTVRRLVARGELNITGRPAGHVQVVLPPMPTAIVDEVRDEFSEAIIETGVTSSPNQKAKKAESGDSSGSDDGDQVKKRKRRRRLDVES